MIPSVGQTIIVYELPSYKREFWPKLPATGTVVRIYPYQYFIVCIDGVEYELYEDDGYKI